MSGDRHAITIARSARAQAGRAAEPVIVMGLGSGTEWSR